MATLIPALGACTSRMTSGERRLAERVSDDTKTSDLCAQILVRRKLPPENRFCPGDIDPASNQIKVMTMHASKGQEFPVEALPGAGHVPAKGKDEQEAAQVFYVAATRATQRLILRVSGQGGFGSKWH